MPILIAPPDPAVGETGADPCIWVYYVPPVDHCRPHTPAQPLHLRGEKPPVLPLCPAKTTTASAPESTPSRSRESPGGASGDVSGSTQGSWTGTDPSGEVCVRHEIVDPASGEGLPTDRGTDGIAAEDAVRAGEGLHEQVEVGDAPFDERHPGVIQEVFDVHPPPGGEVVDDDDVVMLCQGVCKVRAKPAPPVTMERMKSLR